MIITTVLSFCASAEANCETARKNAQDALSTYESCMQKNGNDQTKCSMQYGTMQANDQTVTATCNSYGGSGKMDASGNVIGN